MTKVNAAGMPVRRKSLFGGSGETWHRKGYHRFFEGYTEFKVSEGGKTRIRRVYTSDYYLCSLPAGARAGLRLLYTALAFLAAFLFFRAGMLHTAANAFLPINLLQAGTLIMMSWFAISLGHYLVSFRKMEIRQYKNSVTALRDSSYVAAAAAGVLSLTVVVYMLTADQENLSEETAAALMSAGAALSLFAVGLTERRVSYRKVKSTARVPENAEDAYVIRG